MGAFVYNYRDGYGDHVITGGYVQGTELNDTICNGGYYNDYSYDSLQSDWHYRGNDVIISASNGDDVVLNYGNRVYISGGNGNDSIKNVFGEFVTIGGGKGDDSIICWGLGRELIEYASGDGNDTIYNFFHKSEYYSLKDLDYECIYITSGEKVDRTYFNNSDFVLEIGDGSITIKDAQGKNFKIQDSYLNGGSGSYTKIKVDYDNHSNGESTNNENEINLEGGEDNPANAETQNNEGNGNSIGKENENNSESGGDNPVNGENPNNEGNNDSNVDTSSNNYEGFYSIKDFEELFKDEEDSQEEAQQPYWTPKDLETFLDAFNFYLPIPKVENVADVTARVSSILDSTIKISDKIAKGELSGDALKGEALKVVGDISAIIGDVKDLKGKDSMGWALSSNILESAGSWISISALNEVELTDEDKKRVSEALSATGDLGIEVVEDVIKKIAGNQGISDYELKRSGFVKKIKNLMNAGLAVMMVAYEGCNQFRESIKEGLEEELPIWAVAEETFADGIMAGIYGGVHQLTRGLDDLAFKGLRWLAYKVSGQEPILSEKTYAEWISEFGKLIVFGSTNADDTIDIQHDNEVCYAQDGNDYIRNGFSNVKIYAGKGKDTISSYADTTSNFISGGDNKDRITSSSDKSTIQGDNGADKIIILGSNNEVFSEEGNDVILLGTTTAHGNTIDGGNGDDVLVAVGSPDNTENFVSGNKFYGEAGNDHIYLFGAKDSTVRGGAGYDYIVLGDTYNTVIEYSKGHGKDVIVGYNETDTIRFREKTEYSTVASGNDITIYVGDGQIFLQGANGKTLNIFQGFSEEDTTMENRIKQQMQFMGDLSVVRSVRGDLRLRESEGEVSVEDVRDNLLNVTDDNGNITSQVYVARAEGGEVAGNALGGSPNIFKVIVGASESQNQLIAGDAGSSLFGGLIDDILQGGISRDAFNYDSGNDTIRSYEAWEDVTFGGTYENWAVTGDDFVINAAEGSLRITNARDKLLEFKNSDGSVLAHVCMPSDDSTFDGSTYNEFVVAVGANNHNNILIAGNAGSSLWGGDGDNSDNLFGGAGADAFIYHYGNGEDNIFNASSEDIVLLPDITLNEIHSVFENQNKVDIGFTDGGALNIDGKVSSYILRSNEYPAKPTPFSIEQLKRGVMEK